MLTPPLASKLISDGVASTCRMHPVYRDLGVAFELAVIFDN
jgi:hypothetical protein